MEFVPKQAKRSRSGQVRIKAGRIGKPNKRTNRLRILKRHEQHKAGFAKDKPADRKLAPIRNQTHKRLLAFGLDKQKVEIPPHPFLITKTVPIRRTNELQSSEGNHQLAVSRRISLAGGD
jgi:hypothetical protein